MRAFLSQSKKLSSAWTTIPPSQKVHFVLGNEACDLDSVVSALTFGYLKQILLGSDTVVIPIVNVDAEDLPLRTEVAWLMNRLSIPLSELVCWDTIDLSQIQSLFPPGTSVSVGLVDHNKLCARQAFLAPYVTEIIDHHSDEQLYLTTIGTGLRDIQVVGSACTLVASQYVRHSITPEESVALALLLTILVDTSNFDAAMKKTTPLDVSMVESLAPLCNLAEIKSRDNAFQEIYTAKFDVASLTVPQALRKDYKSFTMGKVVVGISSVLELFEPFWKKGGASYVSDLTTYFRKESLDILIIMFGATNPDTKEFNRQIQIFEAKGNNQLFNDVKRFFESEAKEMQFSPLPNQMPSLEGVYNNALFLQGNLGISRKTLSPVLGGFIGKL